MKEKALGREVQESPGFSRGEEVNRPPTRINRVIDTLMAERSAGRLEYGGAAAGYYRATVRGRLRAYDLDRMTAWLDGYEEGRRAGRPAHQHVMSPALRDVWQLLVAPSPLEDGRRLRVLTAMQARGLDITGAGVLVRRRRESVRYALRFGRVLKRAGGHTHTLVALEQALSGTLDRLYGPAWRAPVPAGPDAELAGCGDAPPEPVAFRRARCLLHAHRAGYLVWVAPTNPDVLRRAASYRVVRDHAGEPAEYDVPARLVVPWLQGLADGAGDDELSEALTDRRHSLHHVDAIPVVG